MDGKSNNHFAIIRRYQGVERIIHTLESRREAIALADSLTRSTGDWEAEYFVRQVDEVPAASGAAAVAPMKDGERQTGK